MRYVTIIAGVILLAGCSGSTGDINSESEVIRGCSYIACAIVTHGVIQVFFRN